MATSSIAAVFVLVASFKNACAAADTGSGEDLAGSGESGFLSSMVLGDMQVGYARATPNGDADILDLVCYPAPSSCSTENTPTIVHRIDKKAGSDVGNVGTTVSTMTYPKSQVPDEYNLADCSGTSAPSWIRGFSQK